MKTILAAYADEDADKFNEELAKYQSWLADHSPADLDDDQGRLRGVLQSFEPFYRAWCCMSWRSCWWRWAGWAGAGRSIGRRSG